MRRRCWKKRELAHAHPYRSVLRIKGVFGLTFEFVFYPLKAKSQTKILDPESNFFLNADFLAV
jgi:hypothetical protein